MSTLEPATLTNGITMPRCGFGTAPMVGEEATAAVTTALEAGYRLIDTAEAYGNEDAVGRAIRASGIPRDELFVTTKFNRDWHRRSGPAQALGGSLERLGLDRVDLLLIHWPNPGLDGYVAAWEGMLALLEAGQLRAVGTSNFTPAHLQRLIDATGMAPHVNQLQCNPWIVRDRERAFHDANGIVTQSWGPLGRGWGHDELTGDLLTDPAVVAAAQAHDRTPGQVVLRWHLQLGLSVTAKSATPERIRQNLAVDDFTLTDDEVARITALDRGGAGIVDPDVFGH
ncbi:MAG: aldo/keto reductase [Nitriliruptoraceae bacterium]|nr:aldo/keto reductase [Nitriliruptoraceae bacterium]